MSRIKKMLGLGAGVLAMAAAAPVSAQYYHYNNYRYNYPATSYPYYGSQYGYSQYGYAQPYNYGQYGYAANTNAAASQCSAAVQARLNNRTSLAEIIGSALGVSTSGRVLSVTQVTPRNNGTVRVRGLASSGRYAANNYGPYGVGAYGAMGYNYANSADLSYRCDVGYNGAVYDVRINRR
jgi:hypothetical protein